MSSKVASSVATVFARSICRGTQVPMRAGATATTGIGGTCTTPGRRIPPERGSMAGRQLPLAPLEAVVGAACPRGKARGCSAVQLAR